MKVLRTKWRVHADHTPTSAGFKLDDAWKRCKQRVITTHANVDTRVKPGPTLTEQDVSGEDRFSAIALDAKPFGVAVSSVP